MIIDVIENLHFKDRITEKVYTSLSKNIRVLSYKLVQIDIALYSLNSSYYYFQVYLRSSLQQFGFKLSMYKNNLLVLYKNDNSLICINILLIT